MPGQKTDAPRVVGVDDVAPLQEVSLRLVRRLRRRARTDLTLSQMSALTTLERAGTMPVGELARREQIGKSSITRLVAHLEEQGYVQRDANPDDARSTLATLTEEGRRLLGQVRQRANQFLAHDVSRLDPADQDALLAALPALQALIALKRDDVDPTGGA